MPRVYVVEPQTIFGPEVQRIVGEAGGTLSAMSPTLNLDEIIEAAPDVVLLDIDYTDSDDAEVIRDLRVILSGGSVWDERVEAA